MRTGVNTAAPPGLRIRQGACTGLIPQAVRQTGGKDLMNLSIGDTPENFNKEK
jgi:hypothetical protein